MILLREQSPFCFPNIVSMLATLCQKQNLKHLPINFQPSEVSIRTNDDSFAIFIGVKIPIAFFSAYICQKPTTLMLPLLRLQKVLSICNQLDSSITINYEAGSSQVLANKQRNEEIKIRIHSLKNDEKIVVQMPIKSSFGQMISEKYQQPFDVVQHFKTLQQLPQISLVSDGLEGFKKVKFCCQFKISCIEFLRIISQFVQVTNRILISYQSEIQNNKKYLTFSSQTQQGLKSIVLSQQKSELDQQRLGQCILELSQYPYQNVAQKIQQAQAFNGPLLYKLSSIIKNNETALEEDVTLIMEKEKGLLVKFGIKNGGIFVALICPVF